MIIELRLPDGRDSRWEVETGDVGVVCDSGDSSAGTVTWHPKYCGIDVMPLGLLQVAANNGFMSRRFEVSVHAATGDIIVRELPTHRTGAKAPYDTESEFLAKAEEAEETDDD